MRFRGTLRQSDRQLPVTGTVTKGDDGEWYGSFRWSMNDALAVPLGSAQLITEGTWQILITESSSKDLLSARAGERGTARFRVVNGLA
jgi:hypothetical protein